MRIKVIIPISGLPREAMDEAKLYLEKWISRDTELHVESLRKGPSTLTSSMDSILSIPYIGEMAFDAEKEGFDGIFISCFDDPGIRELREILQIPVIGAFESSLNACTHLCDSISVISPDRDCVPSTSYKVGRSMYAFMVSDIRGVDSSIEDVISGNIEDIVFEEILEVYREGRADGIVLGCTGLFGIYEKLKSRMDQEGMDLLLIEPSAAGILEMERLVKLRLTHSRRTYPHADFIKMV